jgi:hypothetical protein
VARHDDDDNDNEHNVGEEESWESEGEGCWDDNDEEDGGVWREAMAPEEYGFAGFDANAQVDDNDDDGDAISETGVTSHPTDAHAYAHASLPKGDALINIHALDQFEVNLCDMVTVANGMNYGWDYVGDNNLDDVIDNGRGRGMDNNHINAIGHENNDLRVQEDVGAGMVTRARKNSGGDNPRVDANDGVDDDDVTSAYLEEGGDNENSKLARVPPRTRRSLAPPGPDWTSKATWNAGQNQHRTHWLSPIRCIEFKQYKQACFFEEYRKMNDNDEVRA